MLQKLCRESIWTNEYSSYKRKDVSDGKVEQGFRPYIADFVTFPQGRIGRVLTDRNLGEMENPRKNLHM